MVTLYLFLQEVLGKWEVPIYNDTYVMLFFGLLKKLVAKWLVDDPNKVGVPPVGVPPVGVATITAIITAGTIPPK